MAHMTSRYDVPDFLLVLNVPKINVGVKDNNKKYEHNKLL